MSLTASEMSAADIAAVTGGGNNFGFGGDGWWLILLFLFAFNGGWGGGYGNNAGAFVGADVQRGFDQSAIMNGLNGLTASVTSGFAASEVGRANTNMDFMQALWNMQMTQQQCCCDTRSAITALGGTISTEAAENRYALANNTRDIIEATNRNSQAILDKLCALEIDAKNDRISTLERELSMASLNASQVAQTAQIIAALSPTA